MGAALFGVRVLQKMQGKRSGVSFPPQRARLADGNNEYEEDDKDEDKNDNEDEFEDYKIEIIYDKGKKG